MPRTATWSYLLAIVAMVAMVILAVLGLDIPAVFPFVVTAAVGSGGGVMVHQAISTKAP